MKIFKTGEPQFRSFFTTYCGKIVINEMLKDEKEPVLFHNNVSEFGNELVLAYSSGGYKSTSVYFVSSNYSECAELTEQLNIEIFSKLTKKNKCN